MKRKDILPIGAIAIFAILLTAAVLITNRSDGEAFVCVYIENELFAKYPLCEDGEHVISGTYGTNTLVISDNKAFISKASCPDLVCVNTGALEADDHIKTLVCLPNKVTVCIEYE